jgi:hypothetical protein
MLSKKTTVPSCLCANAISDEHRASRKTIRCNYGFVRPDQDQLPAMARHIES